MTARRNQHPVVTAEDIARIDRLYRSGMTIIQIVEHTGRASQTVQKALKAAGTPTRGRGRRTNEEIAEAERAVAEDVDLAFDGEWVRDGLILRPKPRNTEDAYRAHRRAYQREHKRASRAKGAA